MTMATGNHPVLGPGFRGSRAWFTAVALILLGLLTGLVLTYFNPILFAVGVAALVGLVVFAWCTITFPVWTLAFVVMCQILVPVYIRLPLGVPPPLLMLALFVLIIGIAGMIRPQPKRPGRYESLIATVILIYNVALFSTLPGEYGTTSSYLMLVKTVIIPTTLFFAFLTTMRTEDDIRLVFKFITFAAVASGSLGIHEFILKENVIARFFAPPVTIEEDFFLWLLANAGNDGAPYLGGSVYRVYSFFTQPLEYSAFMIMAFPFAALSFVTATTWTTRAIYGAATLIIFVGFMVSFSRGPTVALALVIIFLAVYERRVRVWALAGAGLILAALVVYWPVVVEKLGERVTSSENVTLRIRLWQNGLKIFNENFINGIGYGSYPNYHVESIRVNQIGPMYEYTWPHIERVTTVENIFVTLAAETGLLGLSAFALVLGIGFYVFRLVYKRIHDDKVRLLALSACAACLAYLLSGMTVANIIGYTISILFFGVYIPTIAVLSCKLPEGRRPLRLKNPVPGGTV